MSWEFHVGQKVECVDISDDPGCYWVWGDAPTLGEVYTVASIYMGAKGISLVLKERPRDPRSIYRGYLAKRFRPLVEDRLQSLRSLLNPLPTKQRESEDA